MLVGIGDAPSAADSSQTSVSPDQTRNGGNIEGPCKVRTNPVVSFSTRRPASDYDRWMYFPSVVIPLTTCSSVQYVVHGRGSSVDRSWLAFSQAELPVRELAAWWATRPGAASPGTPLCHDGQPSTCDISGPRRPLGAFDTPNRTVSSVLVGWWRSGASNWKTLVDIFNSDMKIRYADRGIVVKNSCTCVCTRTSDTGWSFLNALQLLLAYSCTPYGPCAYSCRFAPFLKSRMD
jgi:hypothetical protein